VSTDSGPDILSGAERMAIRRREQLRELLRSTCIHLHAPEGCEWCIRKELGRAAYAGRQEQYSPVEIESAPEVTP